MEINVENVEKALLEFYQSGAISSQHEEHHQQIHSYLNAVQSSPKAWALVWQLLEPFRSREVQFFGASCLHIKLVRQWDDVPVEQYSELKERIIKNIEECAQIRPKAVQTRLCVALAAYALRAIAAGTWHDVVDELVKHFGSGKLPGLSDVQVCGLLLEIVTVLPEEHHSYSNMDGKSNSMEAELRKGIPHVLTLVKQILTETSCPTQLAQQALHCFGSWINLASGIPMNDCQQLIQLTLHAAVYRDELFEHAVDAAVSVFTHPTSHNYPNTVCEMLPHILALEGRLSKAVLSQDLETCLGIFKIIISMAECHSRLLAECTLSDTPARPHVIKVIQLILQCSSMPGQYPVEETCSELPFGFWYILQDDILSFEGDNFTELLSLFRPVYRQLVDIFLAKSRFPTDEEYSGWIQEDKEQFRCYRQDVADTAMYAHHILKGELLSHLCTQLGGVVEQAVVAVEGKSEQAAVQVWPYMESCLHLIDAVGENILDQSQEEVVGGQGPGPASGPQLGGEDSSLLGYFDMLPRIPFGHPRLVETALQTVGTYAEWIGEHPQVLQGVVPLLIQGLENKSLACSATMSLRDVCRDCPHQMALHVHAVMSAVDRIMSGSDGGVVEGRDLVRLIEAAGHLLSVFPEQQILEYCHGILGRLLPSLECVVQQEPNRTSLVTMTGHLDILTALCASLNVSRHSLGHKNNQDKLPEPVLTLLPRLLPVVSVIAKKFASSDTIVQAIFELLRRTLGNLLNEAGAVLPEMTQIIVDSYLLAPHTPQLDMVKQICILFSREAQHQDLVVNLFNVISECTLNLLSSQGCHEHTDIMESYMLILCQLSKKCLHLFLDPRTAPLNSRMFECAMRGLEFTEAPTVKASVIFLFEFVMHSQRQPVMTEVVGRHGRSLLQLVLLAVGGKQPRTLNDMMADVLYVMSKHYLEPTSAWLRELTTAEGSNHFPSALATPHVNEMFVSSVIRERANKRKVRESVTSYSLFCRGLLGSTYAAQTSSSSLPSSQLASSGQS